MPKVIKDIEETIFEAASELFGEQGYKNTDMKEIAQKSGIAVGTLYNYYSNKKALFLTVFKKSWENTFVKLDEIIEEEGNSLDRIKKLIRVIYLDVEKRGGMGNQLLKENIISEEEVIKTIKEDVLGRIGVLIQEIETQYNTEIEESKKDRLVKMLFMTILAFINEFKGEKEENFEFIDYLLDSLLIK